MSTRNSGVADATKHCTTNDIEDFDDAIDFLSENVYSIVRILIPDERTRVKVMAKAFAKCFFDEAYTGEPLNDIELAKNMVGEYLAGITIDNDPMLYTNFYEVCGDEDSDDDSDDSRDRNHCPYRDDIPRYVYEDGLIRRIDVRRGSDD